MYALPTDRVPPSGTWAAAGAGGIPPRTTISATLTSAASATTIQAAINACPSGQTVLLGAGTYTLTAGLTMKAGVTLRGAGRGSTILTFSGVTAYALIYVTGGGNFTPQNVTNWTAGYTQSTTTVTLASVTGYSVGQLFVLDQTTDSAIVSPTSNDDLGRGTNRTEMQMVKITGIAGNNVTFAPGLYMANFSTGLTPQAWTWGTGRMDGAGIEDLTVDGTGCSTGYNIAFEYTYQCWLKNIESKQGGTSHIFGFRTKNLEIRDSFFNLSRAPGVTAYGVDMRCCFDCLIENNAFYGITTPILPRSGSQGCVLSYNYCENMDNQLTSWMAECFSSNHETHPCMNLFEGNIGTLFYGDYIHGSSSHTTAFRNVFYGHEGTKDNNTQAVVLEKYNRYYTFVGNVLGTAGYHTKYQDVNTTSTSPLSIYKLGYAGTDNSLTGYDQTTADTALRHANYDVVTAGIVYNASDDHSLPDSLYLASKPIWFGNLTYPPIEPGSPSTSHTIIPAGYRFVNGVDPSPAASGLAIHRRIARSRLS